MMFWKRENDITSIGTLDPVLPQTVEQCKKTFGGEWEELKETLNSEFAHAYLGDSNYDLDQCKTKTSTRLRVERKPLLEAQDILFQRAQETGADIAGIVTEKQRLRDITKGVDSCTTIDALKALNCDA